MKKRLCSNFNSPRGDNVDLIFDDKNNKIRKTFPQQQQEKHTNLTTEKSKKIGGKEFIYHAKEVMIRQISGYYRWIQLGMKMIASLKTICFHGNCSFTNTKSLFTRNSAGETDSITSIASIDLTYIQLISIHFIKIILYKIQMCIIKFPFQRLTCCLSAEKQSRKLFVPPFLNKRYDKDHLASQKLSDASFIHTLLLRTTSYNKVPRNIVLTKTFNMAQKIHSLYRTQTRKFRDRISNCLSLPARLIFSISWKGFRNTRSLTKHTNLSKSFLLCLLLSVFGNAGGAKVGGGFGCKNQKTSDASQACLPKEYSKYELPNPSGVNPIKVELLIQEVLRINDKDYSITFSCYYNIYWPDKRIRLSHNFGQEMLTKDQMQDPNFNLTNSADVSVPMNLEMIKDLWLPNILIYNLKTFKVMDVLSKLAGLWISADYTVLYSTATHITFICPMHFDKFPLDTQSCKFQVGSYSYDDSQMTFQTLRAGYDGKAENSIALDYAIEIKRLSQQDSILLFDGLGNFSLAGFELVLNRYVSTYIITYYLPSGLFVIVSWISFLIPMDVIPGRMALLVTLFLVLVNIFNNVTTNTPKAEGLTAIEAWMLACILFVFGALIE